MIFTAREPRVVCFEGFWIFSSVQIGGDLKGGHGNQQQVAHVRKNRQQWNFRRKESWWQLATAASPPHSGNCTHVLLPPTKSEKCWLANAAISLLLHFSTTQSKQCHHLLRETVAAKIYFELLNSIFRLFWTYSYPFFSSLEVLKMSVECCHLFPALVNICCYLLHSILNYGMHNSIFSNLLTIPF